MLTSDLGGSNGDFKETSRPLTVAMPGRTVGASFYGRNITMTGQRLLLFTNIVLLLLVSGCLPAVAIRSGDEGARQLEMVRGLVGNWVQLGPAGEETGITTAFRETAAGSAIEEILFEGTEHEMVTMYHLDEGRLMLTHYCVLGNQPRLVAVARPQAASTIDFRFLDGTGMNPRVDVHMHEAVFEFVDENHYRVEWTSFRDGKVEEATLFDMTRVTPAVSGTP